MIHRRLADLWRAGPSQHLRYPCGGRLVWLPAADALVPYGTIFLFAALIALYGIIVWHSPLHWGAIGAGIAAVSLVLIQTVRIFVSDPGTLPKHISSLAGLCPELKAPAHALSSTAPTALLLVDGQAAVCRFCLTCRIWRPPGAYHCSKCGVCIERHDHHCGVLGKCVGAGNMHAFLAFLWSVVLATVYSLAYSLAAAVLQVMEDDEALRQAGGSWKSDGVQHSLWVSGGVLLSMCALCMGTMRRTAKACLGSLIGVVVGVLPAIIGGLCLIIAYTRAAPSGARIVPSFIGILCFGAAAGLATITATAQTAISASEKSTRERHKAATGAGKATASGGLAGFATSLFKAATADDEGPPDQAKPSVVAGICRLMTTFAPAREVHFHSDASSLHSFYGRVQRYLFDKASYAQEVEAAAYAARAAAAAAAAANASQSNKEKEQQRASQSEDPAAALGTTALAVAAPIVPDAAGGTTAAISPPDGALSLLVAPTPPTPPPSCPLLHESFQAAEMLITALVTAKEEGIRASMERGFMPLTPIPAAVIAAARRVKGSIPACEFCPTSTWPTACLHALSCSVEGHRLKDVLLLTIAASMQEQNTVKARQEHAAQRRADRAAKSDTSLWSRVLGGKSTAETKVKVATNPLHALSSGAAAAAPTLAPAPLPPLSLPKGVIAGIDFLPLPQRMRPIMALCACRITFHDGLLDGGEHEEEEEGEKRGGEDSDSDDGDSSSEGSSADSEGEETAHSGSDTVHGNATSAGSSSSSTVAASDFPTSSPGLQAILQSADPATSSANDHGNGNGSDHRHSSHSSLPASADLPDSSPAASGLIARIVAASASNSSSEERSTAAAASGSAGSGTGGGTGSSARGGEEGGKSSPAPVASAPAGTGLQLNPAFLSPGGDAVGAVLHPSASSTGSNSASSVAPAFSTVRTAGLAAGPDEERTLAEGLQPSLAVSPASAASAVAVNGPVAISTVAGVTSGSLAGGTPSSSSPASFSSAAGTPHSQSLASEAETDIAAAAASAAAGGKLQLRVVVQ